MVKNNDKKFTKIFISETLGTRKYFSYRADLILYKIIFSIIIFTIIYLRTSDIIFSTLMSVQVFIVFSLINKMNISRKEKEGKEILISKKKKEFFYKRLHEMRFEEYEDFIQLLLYKEGYSEFEKIGKYMYSANKGDHVYYIKIFKLYENAEIEKIDLRSFINYMSQNKIKNGILITVNNLSEDAEKLIDNLNNSIAINHYDSNKLFEFAQKSEFLPDNKYFYSKIYEEIPAGSNKTKIKNNTLNNKKIVTYILAACFFYITWRLMPYNSISLYICYYFVLLAFINTAYFLYIKIRNKNIEETSN